MIDLSGDISIPFLKKSPFTGSYRGMRYMLQKKEQVVKQVNSDIPERTEIVLQAVIWPEPMNFKNTPEEKKYDRFFRLDQEGLAEAIAWLNKEYAAGRYERMH